MAEDDADRAAQPAQHFNELTFQIATISILRVVVGVICHHGDRDIFRRNMAELEERAVAAAEAFELKPMPDPQLSATIQAAAQGWISRILASVTHPSEGTGNNNAKPRGDR